jgi:succinyl-CoA synthetase beta subunit
MDLLEYQAKKLFTRVGIPILPSQTIADTSEIKRLQIPYPVVLKSQVRAGGRGRAGGIRFVENTIDAIAAARTIFNLSILGEFPEVILAEARYNTEQEFFLAILLDYQLQRPVLLGSTKGGIDVETLLEHMQKVVVDDDFSPFYARRLAIAMGLQGKLIHAVSSIIEKMYSLFEENDLDIVEINPLAVSADGELMALDGKISVNDNAIARHPNIVSLIASKKETNAIASTAAIPEPRWLEHVDEKGNVSIISNSLGLALTSWDLVVQDKGKPACCLVIGEEVSGKFLAEGTLERQLGDALEQVMEVRGLKVILINLLANQEIVERLAQNLQELLQPHLGQNSDRKGEERATRATNAASALRKRSLPSRSSKMQPDEPPQIVIRLGGGEIESFKENLSELPIHWTDDLDDAIAQTISIAKSK